MNLRELSISLVDIFHNHPSTVPLPVSRLVICLNFCIKITLQIVLLQYYCKLAQMERVQQFWNTLAESMIALCSVL